MEFNPYNQEYNRLKSVLKNRKDEKHRLSAELSWFDSSDIDSMFHSLNEIKDSKNKLQSLIDATEEEIESLHKRIQETKSHIKTLFNPLNWFNNKQKTYRKKLNQLTKMLSTKHYNIERAKKSLTEKNELIRKQNKEIDKFKNFDRKKVYDEVAIINQEIVLLEEEFIRVSESKNSIDIKLQPVLNQINNYESKISTARENIRKAKSFEHKLDVADNSYERAMIHEECERILGEGSPKKIIRDQERLIRRLERDLEKANKRATKIGKKAARDIRKIVIDGNNMCYEDSNFVGLEPLVKLTKELQKNYGVIIVFDSAIRSQVKAHDKTIRAQFNNNIKVHVVATKQQADETILDIASKDSFCYVLSNDRYGEYKEKEVVNDNRLIRHEIVDGKVIVHDLNINIRYG